MAIICGYAGVGKTWFAKYMLETVEILSMPYAWLLPKESNKTVNEMEQDKGAYYQHLPNPGWPMNMILAILKAEKKYKNVVIPTITQVIEILYKDYGKECILVYPEDGLQEEYKQRYIKRGNNETFLRLFVDGMEERLKEIKGLKGKHIRLSPGQFMFDVGNIIEEWNKTRRNIPIANGIIKEIEEEQKEIKKNLVLVLFGIEHEYAYRVADIDDAAVVQFLYDVGVLAYKLNLIKPTVFSMDIVKLDSIVWVKTQEEFLEAMYKVNDAVKM